MEVTTVGDLASTISTICDDVTHGIDLPTSEYSKECERLRQVLLQLHDILREFERSRKPEDMEDMVERVRVSLSKTYALVEIIIARRKRTSLVKRMNPFFQDELRTMVEGQLCATESLLNHLQHDLGFVAEWAASSLEPSVSAFGVHTFDLCTEGELDKRLVRGDFVNIPVTDSENRVMYSVHLWLNYPKKVLRRMARTMSARVECKYQLDPLNDFNYQFPDVFDISMHAKGDSGKLFPKECVAFITLSAVLQAQVKSFRPESNFPNRPGAVLRRGPVWGFCKNTGQCNAHLRSERYRAEVWFETAALQGLRIRDLKMLCIQGIKQRKQLYYKCFVGATGEVLAIYRHDKKAERGKIHLLGMGNQQDVRDIIVSSFVALGLTSKL